MSKKQVIFASLLVALPAIGLLTALVFGAIDHRGNMFSGLMTVIVAVTGLLLLVLGLSPVALMAFYPAEGFAALGPPPEMPAAQPGRSPGVDEDEDEFDDDEAVEDEFDEFDDDGGFDDDDGFEDNEELFDSEDEEFEDDDDWE